MNSRVVTEPDKPRRKYNSTRRSLQAAQTRDDVLTAAIRLFSTAGWAGTTIAGIASDAGVAVETIYSGFGSKKALLRAAMDVAIVGDAEPIPFADREATKRMGEGTLTERIDAAVEINTDVQERSAGVWSALIEAAAADPEIDVWRQELERGRRIDVARAVRAVLGPDVDVDELTIDLAWVMVGPEVYLKVTSDLGRTRSGYEAFMREGFSRIITSR